MTPLRSRPLSSLITASGHARRAFAAHDKTNNAGHPAGGMPSRNDANKNIARKQNGCIAILRPCATRRRRIPRCPSSVNHTPVLCENNLPSVTT